MRVLLSGAVMALLAVPATADAHSTVQIFGSEVTYASEDVISDNRLTVTEDATEVVFHDPEADAGIQSSDYRCRATRTRGATVIEVRCRKAGLTRLSVDAGPNEDTVQVTLGSQWQAVGVAAGDGRDTVTVRGPSSDILSGDQGDDAIDAGDGDDDVRGGDGDDTLAGGSGGDRLDAGVGADVLDGGDGDDEVAARDGLPDGVRCGAGADGVSADTADAVAEDCEAVERSFVPRPPGSGGPSGDRTKPELAVGGRTVQRVTRRRRSIRLAATSSERGFVSASGFLAAGGLNFPLRSRTRRIDVAGGGASIHLKLSRRAVRHVLRDLRRGRRPVARVRVGATDEAGNTTVSRRFRVRLRR